MNFEELVQDYLKDKKLDNPTAQQLSKAQSYSHCYLWYLSEMKVAHDTAAMASDVWVNKYALQSSDGTVLEQTPVDTWKREATALANEEIRTNPINKDFNHWFGVFYSALEGWKYSPQGSGIYALGNPYVKASVSNCFVAPSPKDNLESIFDTGKYMARTYASRGGVGINLNGLRPFGAMTNNAAKTSTGAASFMDFYSYITGMIGQEGRRGALMQCMSVHHPDIMRFIEMKSDRPLQPFFEELLGVGININDWRYSAIADRLKSTSFANVSVMLSDEFMTAVKNKTDYEQRYTFLDGKYAPISKMVSAEDIWSKLMFSAWKSAEPGILFWDLVSRESTSDYYGKMASFTFIDPMTGEEVTIHGLNFAVSATNPCVTGDTRLHTQAGMTRVSDLYTSGGELQVTVDNRALGLDKKGTDVRPAVPVFKTAPTAEVYRVTTSDGYEIKATSWHDFYTERGKIPLKQLVPGDKLLIQSGKGQFGALGDKDLGILLGLLTGDGHFTNRGKGTTAAVVNLWNDDRDIAPEVVTHINQLTGKVSTKRQTVSAVAVAQRNMITIRSVILARWLDSSLGFNKDTKLRIPEIVWQGTEACVRGYLSALFQCDGTVNISGKSESCSIRLSSSYPDLLKDVQAILANFGVFCRIRKRRSAGIRQLPNGSGSSSGYACKANYELIIDGESRERFMNEIGFIGNKKNQKYQNWVVDKQLLKKCNYLSTISSIDYVGEEAVYDTTQVDHNTVIFNGLVTGQCGEQPLPEDDSCCLGTHYLVAFVKNAWTDNAEFDFEEYERVLRIAVRAQDNIKGIDAASLSIQSQRAMALLLRRIGLGNTGLSDCMAALGIRYDTEEAIEFVNKLYTFLRDTTYDESVKLAQEKGAFMAFDWEKHKNSPYIQRLPKPIQNNIKKYGIRNVALLTQAPNGSMSILMRNCSSGSEPMFLLASTRNMKVSGTGGDVVQYTLYHQAVQDALNAGWTKELVAEYFVAAGDVDPRTRVRMQGAMQKLIDSAISITTNLKETATVEEVRDLYEMAHEYGCKGFTVYRDKCRTGVLNAIKEDVGVNKRVSRPKVTHADIHKTRYKDKSYMILVGNVDGKPIEVFGGLEDGLSLPTQYHLATLTKKSRGHYTLAVQLSEDEEDQLKINDIGKRFPAGDIITICRMISLALRNGVSVGNIVEQLSKSNIANMYDAPAVFARVLKQYIPDEEVIEKEKAKGKVCPECGEPLDFRRESGCLVELCSSCAFSNSKCG